VDSQGGPGFELHGKLVELINKNLTTTGPEEMTDMVTRFFMKRIEPAFVRAGIAPPLFVPSEIYIHLSSLSHTKNNRVAATVLVHRLLSVMRLLGDEIYDENKGSSDLAKAREHRFHVMAVHALYQSDPSRYGFGTPVAGDIMPETTGHLSRATIQVDEAALPESAASSWLYARTDSDDDEGGATTG
jgi:hypothetical protein